MSLKKSTGAWITSCSGQFSALTVSPSQLLINSTVTIRAEVSPPSIPFWITPWRVNGTSVFEILVNPEKVIASPSNPQAPQSRYTTSITPTNFTGPNRNFTVTLTIRDLRKSDNGAIVSLGFPFQNPSSITLNILGYCREVFSGFGFGISVESSSATTGSPGNFTCPDSAKLFYENGTQLSSPETVCTNLSTWKGEKGLQCWFAPTDVQLSIINAEDASLGFILLCSFKPALPPGNMTRFNVGGVITDTPVPVFEVTSISREQVGKEIYCQPLTPYTEIFPQAAISNRLRVPAINCRNELSGFGVSVESSSATPGSPGNFTCPDGAKLFYENGTQLSSPETVCTNLSTWKGEKGLQCLFDCRKELSDLGLSVESRSVTPGSPGTFTCPDGGKLFYENGAQLSSPETVCTNSSTWKGEKGLQCWFVPTDVKLDIIYLDSAYESLSLVCGYKATFPPLEMVRFNVGGEITDKPLPFFDLKSISREQLGKDIYCQPLTSYTRVFPEAAISNRLHIPRIIEPTLNVTSLCVWYVDQSAICDVVFDAEPDMMFMELLMNETNISDYNNGTNNLNISNTHHRYRFQRDKASFNDSGTYSLGVRYTTFPGLRYVFEFAIEVHGLPEPTVKCSWFIGVKSNCDVTIPDTVVVVSINRNGVSIPLDILRSVSRNSENSTLYRISAEEASVVDSGTYVITLQTSSTHYDVVVVHVYVLEYPFNPVVAIVVTLVILLVLGVILILLVHRAKRRAANKATADVQMVNVKKVSRGTT